MVTIQSIESDLQGAKRQYLPFVIEWQCPDCGKDHEKDMTDSYLSYPEWGSEEKIQLFCLDCDEMEPVTSIRVTPDISLKIES